MGKIFIGTSGYSYKHWRENFYPKELSTSKWLNFYARTFNTVELNVTFYRLPTKKMYESWLRETPADFVFSLKGSRYITQIKRLYEVEKGLKLFLEGASVLGPRAKVLLWQFSPGFEINLERLEEFLKLLDGLPYDQAFEFRHKSWFQSETYSLLKEHQASLVYADSPAYPATDIKTADFIYVRFHGGKILYGSDYSKKELEEWAKKIKELDAKRTYIYFNNDAFGFAIKNAKKIKELLE